MRECPAFNYFFRAPPTPAPAEVIGQAEVAADDRDRERNNQGDRVGEIRGRDTDRGQAGNRQDRAVNDNKGRFVFS